MPDWPIIELERTGVHADFLRRKGVVVIQIASVKLVDQRWPNGPIEAKRSDVALVPAAVRLRGIVRSRKFLAKSADIDVFGHAPRAEEAKDPRHVVVNANRGIVVRHRVALLPFQGFQVGIVVVRRDRSKLK